MLDTFGLMSRCASLTAMLSLRRHQSSQHEPGVGRHAGCTGQVQPGRIAESGGRVASAGAGHGGSSRPVRAETCHLSSHDDRRPQADPVPDRCLHLAASVYICADAGFLSPTTSVQYNTNPTAPIAVSADNDVNACSQGRQGLGHVAAAPRAVVRPQLHFQPSRTSSTAEGALMLACNHSSGGPRVSSHVHMAPGLLSASTRNDIALTHKKERYIGLCPSDRIHTPTKTCPVHHDKLCIGYIRRP